MLGEDGGEGTRMEDGLESGVEEAGVPQVIETTTDGELIHVEAIPNVDNRSIHHQLSHARIN
jgi:hypothetical protein